MRHVEVAGLAVEPTSGAPLVVLREHDAPHRLLPIFIGGPEAAAIALAASGQTPPRPLAHDLMAALVRSLDGHLDAVEVTELRGGSFLASLAVHGPSGERRLDTRPSDAIALAIRLGAPLFVADAVMDEAGTLQAEEIDEGAVDAAVEEFRSFLDDVDPAEFADADADADTAHPDRHPETENDGEPAGAVDDAAADNPDDQGEVSE